MARFDERALFDDMARRINDARLPQAIVVLPLAVDVLFRIAGAWDDPWNPAALVGYGVLAAACVGSGFARRQRDPRFIAVFPVLDIVAIGLLRSTVGSPVGIALIIPAIWLAVMLGRSGVVVAVIVTVVALVLPGLSEVSFTLDILDRAILILLIVILTSSLVALARSSLLQQQAKLTALLDTVDVGVMTVDRFGRVETSNPQQDEFLALADPDGLDAGRSFIFARDAITPVPVENYPLARALRGEEYSGSMIWVGEDPAARRAISVSSRNLYDGSGALAGAVIACADVTELLRALAVKDTFIAAVSHELRTPLTSILGYLDLASERDLDPEIEALLDPALRNVDRLARVVNDLIGNAQRAGFALESMPVRLDQVVANTVADLQVLAQDAEVQLETTRLDVAPAYGDPDRLAMVADNLVSNAIKYSNAGDRVDVEVHADPDAVRFVVRDTGIGIAPEDREHVFDRFYRAEAAREMGLPGVGLGLATCKEIVEAHGGTIALTDRPGPGSEFVVTLPAG